MMPGPCVGVRSAVLVHLAWRCECMGTQQLTAAHFVAKLASDARISFFKSACLLPLPFIAGMHGRGGTGGQQFPMLMLINFRQQTKTAVPCRFEREARLQRCSIRAPACATSGV